MRAGLARRLAAASTPPVRVQAAWRLSVAQAEGAQLSSTGGACSNEQEAWPWLTCELTWSSCHPPGSHRMVHHPGRRLRTSTVKKHQSQAAACSDPCRCPSSASRQCRTCCRATRRASWYFGSRARLSSCQARSAGQAGTLSDSLDCQKATQHLCTSAWQHAHSCKGRLPLTLHRHHPPW